MPFLVTQRFEQRQRLEQTPRNITQPIIHTPENVIQKPINTRRREAVFTVKPDIQNDVYHLYCSDGKEFGFACIPDYKTSVMMNTLFRTIKENKNLDALEESDDEEEFQNDKVDRFVFLDKAYKMVCVFHTKFKKWYPVRLADESARLIDRRNL